MSAHSDVSVCTGTAAAFVIQTCELKKKKKIRIVGNKLNHQFLRDLLQTIQAVIV